MNGSAGSGLLSGWMDRWIEGKAEKGENKRIRGSVILLSVLLWVLTGRWLYVLFYNDLIMGNRAVAAAVPYATGERIDMVDLRG